MRWIGSVPGREWIAGGARDFVAGEWILLLRRVFDDGPRHLFPGRRGARDSRIWIIKRMAVGTTLGNRGSRSVVGNGSDPGFGSRNLFSRGGNRDSWHENHCCDRRNSVPPAAGSGGLFQREKRPISHMISEKRTLI